MYFARCESGKRKIFYVTKTTSGWSTALELQGLANKSGFDDEPT